MNDPKIPFTNLNFRKGVKESLVRIIKAHRPEHRTIENRLE